MSIVKALNGLYAANFIASPPRQLTGYALCSLPDQKFATVKSGTINEANETPMHQNFDSFTLRSRLTGPRWHYRYKNKICMWYQIFWRKQVKSSSCSNAGPAVYAPPPKTPNKHQRYIIALLLRTVPRLTSHDQLPHHDRRGQHSFDPRPWRVGPGRPSTAAWWSKGRCACGWRLKRQGPRSL